MYTKAQEWTHFPTSTNPALKSTQHIATASTFEAPKVHSGKSVHLAHFAHRYILYRYKCTQKHRSGHIFPPPQTWRCRVYTTHPELPPSRPRKPTRENVSTSLTSHTHTYCIDTTIHKSTGVDTFSHLPKHGAVGYPRPTQS